MSKLKLRTQVKARFEWSSTTAVAKATNHSPLVGRAIKDYESFIERITKHHGTTTAVKVLKDLHSRTKLASIGVYLEDITYGGIWCKPNPKTGLPKRVSLLTKLILDDGIWGGRLATSITSRVETMRLRPSTNIETIENGFEGDESKLEYWTTMCRHAAETWWKPKLSDKIRETKYHTSTSAGPNGGASLISANYDSQLFMRDPILKEKFLYWCDTFLRQDVKDMIQQCSTSMGEYRKVFSHLNKMSIRKEPLRPAKLLYLPDKAGKTRVVYCLSWWVQELLDPMHKDLYAQLYRIDEDGTKSHDRAATIVKEWTTVETKQLWSIDLTAATDRFPKVLQEAVVCGIYGKELSKAWSDIMDISPWSEPHNRFVKYGVGQPMGAKTSWAIFALTHHTVLRIICANLGVRHDCYVIIGDDIVISNEYVANNYITFLSDLGIPYSKNKTIFPKEGRRSSAEFAKRIFIEGAECSPLTSSLTDRVWKHGDYPTFLSVLKEVGSKWESCCYVNRKHLHLPTPANELYLSLRKKEWKDVIAASICGGSFLDTYRLKREDLPVGSPTDLIIDNPFGKVDQTVFLYAMGTVIQYRVQRYAIALGEIKAAHTSVQELPGKALVSKVLFHVKGNPLLAVLDRLDEVIRSVYGDIASMSNLTAVLDLGLDLSYMLSLIKHGRSWEAHKRLLERRNKILAAFWKEVLKICQNPEGLFSDEDYY